MRIIKPNKTNKRTHVLLEGTNITEKQLLKLLKENEGVRFNYFGTEYLNFQKIKDNPCIKVGMKDEYILVTKLKKRCFK